MTQLGDLCTQCGKPLTPETMSYNMQEVDLWEWKLESDGAGGMKSTGDPTFSTMETEEWYLEHDCGHQYMGDMNDGRAYFTDEIGNEITGEEGDDDQDVAE